MEGKHFIFFYRSGGPAEKYLKARLLKSLEKEKEKKVV